MNIRLITCCATLALCSVAIAAESAPATAEINFVQPERYADAGDTPLERDATLQVLGRQLQSLAARELPDGQVLQVDVLDVDLAGHAQPTPRGTLRVLRGDREPARLTLRYTLTSAGQALRSGTVALDGLGMRPQLALKDASEPLRDEKALLQRWLRQDLAEPQAAAR